MPHPSGNLSAWLRRDAQDKMMFGYVYGMQRGVRTALPGVTEAKVISHTSIEAAIEAFAKEFGVVLNVKAQAVRFARMRAEFLAEQRTPPVPATHEG